VYDNDVPPLATGFVSEPGIFDSIEAWELWLTEVEGWPDSPMKKYCIWSAKRTIEWKKRHLRAQRLGVEWLQ
jgi:hypothetical protein